MVSPAREVYQSTKHWLGWDMTRVGGGGGLDGGLFKGKFSIKGLYLYMKCMSICQWSV